MCNPDIKIMKNLLYNSKVQKCNLLFCRGIFDKFSHFLALWHNKLKHWHAVSYVGKFVGTLTRKNQQLACFQHVGTQTRWHINHAAAGTQARWHVDHVSAQVRMPGDLANSAIIKPYYIIFQTCLKLVLSQMIGKREYCAS